MSTFSSSPSPSPSPGGGRTHGQAHSHNGDRAHRSGHTALPRPTNPGEGESTGGPVSVLRAALFALPVTAIMGAVLLAVATGVSLSSPDPDAMSLPLSMGALGLTALLGGLVCGRRCGGAPLACGLCSGLLLVITMAALSLAVGDDTRAALTLGLGTWGGLAVRAAVVFLEMLGARMGTAKRRTKPHHTSHRLTARRS